jgi:hypothetical protein
VTEAERNLRFKKTTSPSSYANYGGENGSRKGAKPSATLFIGICVYLFVYSMYVYTYIYVCLYVCVLHLHLYVYICVMEGRMVAEKEQSHQLLCS